MSGLSPCLLSCVLAAASAGAGPGDEMWIAVRADGKGGTGRPNDPLDGSTRRKFDAIMNGLYAAGRKNVTIHLGVGTFHTLGAYVYVAHDPSPGWVADEGWKILGAGMGNTVLKLAGFTYLDPTRIDVSVAGGVWETRSDNGFTVGREVKLVAGSGCKGLARGTVYYVSEVIDSKRFRVSAALGSPTIRDAAIASGGKLQAIAKDAHNTVIASRPWNKRDIEIRDLTIDCNWTGFGTVLTRPFTVPAEQAAVTVSVASSAWAQVNKRAYVQQADYKVVGVYDVLAVPGPKRLVLRNAANSSLPAPRPGGADLRFRGNLRAGTAVPKGTRVCPRVNLAGIGISAPRCRVERVRVTNTGAPIYEGNCGINVVGIGKPGPNWPAAGEIVIRDCVVDNIWGQYGWPIQIHGNNTSVPSRGYGTQALVEGNTIYGNGLHQGLGGWNYVNSLWVHNKVVNCAAAFFTDVGNCRNNIVRSNLFLQCRSYTVILGGGCPLWNAKARYKPADRVYHRDVNYTCKLAHAGQAPPNRRYWAETHRPAFSPFSRYVFEGNVFEVCDHSGPLLFNGNVADTIFRNNTVRYAPGHSKGSRGLCFDNPTNRRLIVTGNVIDSRLKNRVGKSIVFGKDNVDEAGRPRTELQAAPAPASP